MCVYTFLRARSAIIGATANTNQTGNAPPPPPFGAEPLLDDVDAPELLDEELLLDDELEEELELLLEDELEELEDEEELLELEEEDDDDELLELDEPLSCTTALLLVTIPAVLETVTL